MKKILQFLMCFALVFTVVQRTPANAEETLTGGRIKTVYAEFLEDKTEVTREVMEIDGGMAEPVKLTVDYTKDEPGTTYSLVQIKGKEWYKLYEGPNKVFSVDADKFKKDWPCYLKVNGPTGELDELKLLNFRIHTGEIEGKIPKEVSSEFGTGLKIDLSDIFPGAALSFVPFVIPVTVKTYADGRIRMGFGVNSGDVKFWNNARKGELPSLFTLEEFKSMMDEESEKHGDWDGQNMGLIVIWSGWAEGNINSDLPFTGQMQLFIGTGWDFNGQYMVLTWGVTVTVGVDGSFAFSFIRDEENDSYQFQADSVQLGAKAGLELFGGIGLAVLFAVGIYGAGSFTFHWEIYPAINFLHFILAGEAGFKVKLFGKTICSLKLVSGSHDFVEPTLTEGNKALMNFNDPLKLTKDYLLSHDYANAIGESHEPVGETIWHNTDVETPMLNSTWETDRDFSHLLAENIYPDPSMQIVQMYGSSIEQFNMIFIGNDATRNAGNKATLMNCYYDVGPGFVSDPIAIDKDGTADYNPRVTHDDENQETYIVWQDAIEEATPDMTFAEIATSTELSFAKFQVGGDWYQDDNITDFAGTGVFATGAKVGIGKDDKPVIVYYTNSINDPAGLAGHHDVYRADKNLEEWTSTKIMEVDGSIGELDFAMFGGQETLSVSYTDENDVNHVELWQNGKKTVAKENAQNGRFLTYKKAVGFTWYADRKIMIMDGSKKEACLSGDEPIPTSKYKLFGTYAGATPMMIVYTSSLDSSEDAYCLYSYNGTSNFVKIPLTDIDEFALVSDIAAAFTSKKEPIIIYSVQNYDINYDPADTDAETFLENGAVGIKNLDRTNMESVLIGQDDERFTDTTSDLYIKARMANRHVTFTGGEAMDVDHALGGEKTPFKLTISNNGLFDVDKVNILYYDEVIGTYEGLLHPGESAEIEVEATVPNNHANKPVDFVFEATTQNDNSAETRITVRLNTGHLDAFVDHIYEDGKEAVEITVTNSGFSTKYYSIEVRDANTGRKLFTFTDYIRPYQTKTQKYTAKDSLFVKDGHYRLQAIVEENQYDAVLPEYMYHLIRDIETLDSIYGQDVSFLKDPDPEPEPPEEEIVDTHSSNGKENIPPAHINEKPDHTEPEKAAKNLWIWFVPGSLVTVGLVWFVLRKRRNLRE
ncbi:MAG: hypothetical protein II783_07705 [Erysipelotrichales bacterium]|nr:hypothetical protein [Erysipelotrichales bacterium]